MRASKSQFLRDKKLSGDWNAISNGETFEKALLHARAELMERRLSRDEIIGAELAFQALSELGKNEEGTWEFPSPGLNHMIDAMPEKPKSKE